MSWDLGNNSKLRDNWKPHWPSADVDTGSHRGKGFLASQSYLDMGLECILPSLHSGLRGISG